jgi:hypothetical protein
MHTEKPEPGNPFEVVVECEDERVFTNRQCRKIVHVLQLKEIRKPCMLVSGWVGMYPLR